MEASGSKRLRSEDLGRRVVVVSPHLDDAVLSLGATVAGAVRDGADVRVVTVFAGDPEAETVASAHDRACGFATAGEAARRRRAEDRDALGVLGATPVWLPFPDSDERRAGDDRAIAEAIAGEAAAADTVLVPGYPLTHDVHRRLTGLLLGGGTLTGVRAALYIEQPYATWHGLSRSSWSVSKWRRSLRAEASSSLTDLIARPPVWIPAGRRAADWAIKRRALARYVSQLPRLRRRPLLRIALYEALRGGEAVAWIDR